MACGWSRSGVKITHKHKALGCTEKSPIFVQLLLHLSQNGVRPEPTRSQLPTSAAGPPPHIPADSCGRKHRCLSLNGTACSHHTSKCHCTVSKSASLVPPPQFQYRIRTRLTRDRIRIRIGNRNQVTQRHGVNV